MANGSVSCFRFSKGCARLLALFLCASLVFLNAGKAKADTRQGGDVFNQIKKPMPKLPPLSQEDFLAATKLIEKVPHGEKALAYSMRIDKEWQEGRGGFSTNFLLSEKIFLQLDTYVSRPTISGRSRIEIEAMNIDENLSAEQWYISYILEDGITLEAFVTHSDRKVESLRVVMERDYSYYERTLVVINGPKVIMVKYLVPIHYFQQQGPMQAKVLESFKITYSQNKEEHEMLAYKFLDIAELFYPEGWEIFKKPRARMEVTLAKVIHVKGSYGQSIGKKTEGRLYAMVDMIEQGALLEDDLDDYKEQIEIQGMLFGKKLEEDYVFKYPGNMKSTITEVYQGVDSSNTQVEYELWVTAMRGGEYNYFILLVTPSRNEMFRVWASNTQAYKEVLENFRLSSGAFFRRD
ncbi:MAG: hypothetical protein ACTHOO_06860 [Alcanivorax sp.]